MLTRRELLRLAAGAGATAAVGALGAITQPAWASAAGRLGVDWDALRGQLSGDLVLPTDPRYDVARQLQLGQFDSVRPQAVAYCASVADVQSVIRFARDNDLHTVPRSGGHSFGGYSTTDGVVLDVSRMNQVQVGASTVVAGAGTQLVDATNALAPQGLLLAGGLCPTVGLGGFIQGGGIGPQTRRYGMACDRMVAATVVLANGQAVRTSPEEHPDLFWALSGGGGGNMGVVTSFELLPVQVTSMVSYMLVWPWDAASDVLQAWQPWVVAAPNDLAAVLVVISFDAATTTPEIWAFGCWYGPTEQFDRMLDDLVAQVGSAPVSRVAVRKPPLEAMKEFYGCQDLTVEQCHRIGFSPEALMPRSDYYRTRNRMFADPLPGPGVDHMLQVFADDPRAGQFRVLYFETLGGAASLRARTETAYVHRDSRLVAGYTAALTGPNITAEDTAACEDWLASGFRAMDAHSLHESYQNFMDPALPDWRQAYYGENYPRLVHIKHQYDPDRFFDFPRAIS